MKRASRSMLMLLMGVAVLAVLFVVWRGWVTSPGSLDREYLYSRAIEEGVAARAGPGTAALFSEVLPFDTPPDRRPPGADPALFSGTAPASLPCRRSTAQMRSEGAGECSAVYPSWSRRDKPLICRITPCVLVVVWEDLWADPVLGDAIADPMLRDRLCRLRGEPHPLGWPRDAAGLMDCGPWWRARGLGFVGVMTEDGRIILRRFF